MIFDFSCRHGLDFLHYFFPAIPGGLAVLVLFAGLAVLGRFATRSAAFRSTDVFIGWGIVSAAMTLASVFFDRPLFPVALAIFAAMLWGIVKGLRDRYFVAPMWALAIFPGVFLLASVNALGLGSWAYDDFSHWVPNALYVFQHNDVPSKALPALHSLYPGYPYALPFLTYLASLLTGGFLVQGGAMVNFMLFFVFAAALTESLDSSKNKEITWEAFGLFSGALLLGVFLNSTISTFGLTNQGESGTMVLGGALALSFIALLQRLDKGDAGEVRRLSWEIGGVAIAFLLLKQSNLFLFGIFLCAYLIVAMRRGVFNQALRTLPILLAISLFLRLIWQIYANRDLGGGGVAVQPLGQWRFDWLGVFLEGVFAEILWKSTFLILDVGTIGYAIYAMFRPATRGGDLAIFSALVQVCYFFFLTAAFLGSDFTFYTIAVAASFHRYMLHASALALPTFWVAFGDSLPALRGWAQRWDPLGEVRQASSFVGSMVLVFLVPLIMAVAPDFVALDSNEGLCQARQFGRALATSLDAGENLGVISPKNDGLLAFVVDLEMAFHEVSTGKPLKLAWHSDSFHTFALPSAKEVDAFLVKFPETDAIAYTADGYNLVRNIGLKDGLRTGLLKRSEDGWHSQILRATPAE